MEKKNINALAGPQEKFTIDEMSNLVNEGMKTVRLNSTWTFLSEILNGEQFKNSFFDSNKYMITSKIKSNKTLKTAIEKLSHVYNQDDLILNYTVKMTEFFVGNIIEMFLSSEINYLLHIKELYKESYKEKIEGELLNLDLKKEKLYINEVSFDTLLDRIGIIVQTYSELLKIKNSEWLEEYFKLNQNKQERFINLRVGADESRSQDNEDENKAGKEMFVSKIIKTKNKLQQANPGKKISVSAVAREFKIPDSTFREQLKKYTIDFSKI